MSKGKIIVISIVAVIIIIVLMIPTISSWMYYAEINRERAEKAKNISDSRGIRCYYENYDEITNLCK